MSSKTFCLTFLISFLSLVPVTSSSHADIVQRWEFDDDAGTSYGPAGSTFQNGGTVGDARFNNQPSTDHVTDGNGALCITGVNDANRFVTTGNTMTAITSGIVEFSFRYDSLDFSDAAAANVAAGGNMHLFGNVGFGLTAGGGTIVDQFRLQLVGNGGNPELRLQHNPVLAGGGAVNIHDLNATMLSGPFDVLVRIDLDNGGLMDVFYDDGGGLMPAATGLTYGSTTIGGVQSFNQQVSNNNGDLMLNDDSAKVDYVRLETIEVVPEPGSITLLAALGSLTLVLRRRS